MAVIPAGNVGVNAAQEALKELQKQPQGQPQSPEKSFDSVLNKGATQNVAAPNVINQNPQVMQIDPAQQVNQNSPVDKVTRARKSAQAVNQRVPTVQPASSVPSPLKSLLNTWSNDTGAMDKIMNVAMSGQNFSPGQLLVLQSATAKVTLELDAINKLVETASGAVKTTMQTQV
jgi:hypothetical protein